MRPVVLEMDGFASFRQATTIDFTDVDYFALVGPTGSGKSTVIDAITFALYGSVARWDKENVVAPALAPTANRGTVKLVFDARGERYIAMRELRRTPSTGVGLRTSRLERLLDPTAKGGPDDATEVVADQKHVKKAVDDLLGLDFNQFTKCVALPQGDVAEFLHAPTAERQKILTKLLGIEIYQRVGQAAGVRATRYETVAETLEDRIDGFVDATPDALSRVRVRLVELEGLQASLDEALPQLASAALAVRSAAGNVERLAASRTSLAAVQAPPGVAMLEGRRGASEAAVKSADDIASGAERADSEARARLAALPPRATLERLADRHSELAKLSGDRPSLITAVTESAATQAALKAHAGAESARAAELTTTHEKATAARDQVAHALAVATTALATLSGTAAPPGLATLGNELTTASTRHQAAETAAAAARTIHDLARAHAQQAGDPVALDRALAASARVLWAVGDSQSRLNEALLAHTTGRDARERHAAAQLTADAAQEELDVARAANAAHELRSHLVEGSPCPVCNQDVHTLPTGAPPATVRTATECLSSSRSALLAAESTANIALQEAFGSRRTVRSALTTLASAQIDLANARAALSLDTPNVPYIDADSVDSALEPDADPASPFRDIQTLMVEVHRASESTTAELEGLHRAASAARGGLAEAEQTQRNADDELRAAGTAVAHAKEGANLAAGALANARDQLVPLGAPAVDPENPVAGWGVLLAWAKAQIATRESAAETLRAESEAAAEDVAEAQSAATRARAAADESTEKLERAVVDLATAQTRLATAKHRQAELELELASAADAATVQEQLELVAQAEQAQRTCDAALAEARKVRTAAQSALRDLDAELADARAELNSARDALITMGVPPLSPDSLANAWAELTTWARIRHGELGTDLATSQVEADTSAKHLHAAETAIQDAFAASGVTHPTSPVAESAGGLLAAARTEAALAIQRVQERQAEVAQWQADAANARTQAQVARTLALHLRADRMVRWLTGHALQVLVATASDTLMELSGDQFELTSDDSGFLVIDHHDADSIRLVKTLSGGETFQAALALALALSSQLGALSAAGSAQLEAVFIDEGFGTLDDATLETVAATLENLAAAGGRMVGVITHVPALANRVPVRFAVRRDAHGSHVEREGA